ncbi:gamma-glutamyltranspeptidase 3-like protein isoform X1 [Tanacetum coccineum]
MVKMVPYEAFACLCGSRDDLHRLQFILHDLQHLHAILQELQHLKAILRELQEMQSAQTASTCCDNITVVAADNARCSEIGALVLKAGGHAVDAAVLVALCGGVVNPMASGIGMEGRGGWLFDQQIRRKHKHLISGKPLPWLLHSSLYRFYTEYVYQNNLDDKYSVALSMGVPGEIAGVYKAWLQHGRMPWKTLFQPAISLAKDGFTVAPYLASSLSSSAAMIKKDPGLQKVIAEEGPEAFYSGTIGEKLISDVRSAGGILTMEDLRNYEVIVTDAVEVNAMGFKILGMPPPSSGTLGLAFGDQLVGVIGGSGGMYIIPAVIQVFLNHFILGMEPLDAVQSPRVYHKCLTITVDAFLLSFALNTVKRSGLCRLGEKQKEIPVKLLCLAAVSVSKPKSTNEMK